MSTDAYTVSSPSPPKPLRAQKAEVLVRAMLKGCRWRSTLLAAMFLFVVALLIVVGGDRSHWRYLRRPRRLPVEDLRVAARTSAGDFANRLADFDQAPGELIYATTRLAGFPTGHEFQPVLTE
jgi:hypothetical protein